MLKIPTRFAILATGMMLACGAMAQTWPTKPVTVVIGFPPGSGNDVIMRILQPKMAQHLGQQIVVDNRPGASSNIGLDFTARAASDGYTVALASSSYAINIYTQPGTHPLSAFTPVARIGQLPFAAIMNREVPARNITEMAALVKANPGKYFAAAGGPTGSGFLTVQTFRKLLGADMELVVYKGSPLAMTDLFSGRVHIIFSNLASGLPHYRAGKVKLLGVTGPRRNANAPDVPTFSEQGYPDLNIDSWYAFLGPVAIPRPIVDRINAATNAALADKDALKKFEASGVEPVPGTPEDLAAYLKEDSAKWDRLTRLVGVNIINK